MKNLKSILCSLAALSLVAVGCQQKDAFTPGEPDVEGCQRVYFPTQDLSSFEYLSPEAECAFEVIIARELDDEAVVVPVEAIANVEGIFEFGEVRFEAGQKETTFKVTFDKAEMGKQYTVTFAVKDPKFASKYSSVPTYLQFKTMRVEWKYFTNPAGEKAKFTFDQMPFWEEIHTGYVKYYEVEGVRYCVTETDPVEDPEGNAYGFWGTAAAQGEGEVSFVWYPKVGTAAGNQAVLVNNCPVWFASNYGETVYRWDWYEYWTICKPQAALAGMSFPDFVSKYEGNYPVSYYDGNGTFVFHCACYHISAGDFVTDLDDVYLIADGFTRIDYTFDMEADYTTEGKLPLYFKVGADVAKVKVAAGQGKLSATDLNALKNGIVDGSVESALVNLEELALGLEFKSTGMYTVVAVAFNDKDEVVNSADVKAFYVAAEDTEDYAVKASVGLEAVPERYGLKAHNSVAFWIAGEDLTEVHMALVKASKVSMALLGQVKADADGKYALSKEDLEKVNGIGGLYDYVEGLDPKTEYALVVWASNGSLDQLYVETYTTAEMPYVWNLLGVGVLNEPFTTMFGEDAMVINVNVYQDANNPAIYMYNGEGLQLANWFYEQDMTAYEGQYWTNDGVIFDATDPNKVVIDNQVIGFNAGSSYGWPTITTIANGQTVGYGKLADGHLTLTAREYLIGMGTSFYYGPAGYDLALPSAGTKAAPTKVNYVQNHEGCVRTLVSAPAVAKEKISIERGLRVAEAKTVKVAPKAKTNRNSVLKAEKNISIR